MKIEPIWAAIRSSSLKKQGMESYLIGLQSSLVGSQAVSLEPPPPGGGFSQAGGGGGGFPWITTTGPPTNERNFIGAGGFERVAPGVPKRTQKKPSGKVLGMAH